MKTTIVLFGLLLMSALFLQTNSLTRKTGAAGKPPMFQGSRCFDVDPGIGNPNRDDHYRWAQPIDSTRLMNNLSWKIGILFNCQYVSGDQLARGFGQMSGIIGDYVSNPACFNNDPNVTGRDRGAHEQWARTKTREQVRNNLQWKAVAAMKCLNRDYQLAFFADESAVLARIPSGSGGGGGGGGGATISWEDRGAQGQRGKNGQRFSYNCPPGGRAASSLWGSDIYTDDSSICTAAVHAGVITLASGGTVTIEIRPGQGSYRGSTRYGVTSNNWNEHPGAFVFVR